MRLIGQQARQQGADQRIRIEFVEGTVGFKGGHRGACLLHARQSQAPGILLTTKIAGQAAVQAQAKFGKVLAEYRALANTHGGQDIVVVCTKGGLAMSNQVNAAHVATVCRN
ncbi:hypothetical protein GCM10009504_44550 [Pseudomonas laurentiana]|nr:hypothetical protein GCM10009504_44550 [Pseudomonas laurentiana]